MNEPYFIDIFVSQFSAFLLFLGNLGFGLSFPPVFLGTMDIVVHALSTNYIALRWFAIFGLPQTRPQKIGPKVGPGQFNVHISSFHIFAAIILHHIKDLLAGLRADNQSRDFESTTVFQYVGVDLRESLRQLLAIYQQQKAW